MCLLDAVEVWDQATIRASSVSHRDPHNPLRRGGRLAALHAVEYAAQTAAVHGGLLAGAAGSGAKPALLAALRDCCLLVDTLDDQPAPLLIDARRLLTSPTGVIYSARVSAADRLLAEVRLTVLSRSDDDDAGDIF